MNVVIELFGGIVENVWGFFNLDAAQVFLEKKRSLADSEKYEYVLEGVKAGGEPLEE